MESPITADAPGVEFSPAKTAKNSEIGLRITVDLSEDKRSDSADAFIVNRLLADEGDEGGDEGEDSKTDAEVRFVDNSGLFTDRLSNVIVTRDKKYVNRKSSGADLDIGIERNTDEWKEKVAKRGSRFGTGIPEFAIAKEDPEQDIAIGGDDFDMSSIYESVGLTPEILTKESLNLRLSAIHVRGLDDMSTEDVLGHFALYNPSYLEWIDDTSCNVVWKEEISSARALNGLSVALESSITEDANVEKAAQLESEEKMEVASEPQQQEPKVGEPSSGELTQANDEIIEDEDDSEEKLKKLGVAKMYADRESGEASSDEDAFTGSGPKRAKSGEIEDADRSRVIQCLKWRTAFWPGRKGLKGRKLFMRFATIFDKKQQGANKYSKYYEKYGNPNYNNMPGLISNSMRRRMAGTQRRQQLEEARAALKALGGGHRDTDAAMSELAAMGSGTAVGDEEDIGLDQMSAEAIIVKNKAQPDLRKSGWTSRTSGGNGRPFTLSRTGEDDDDLSHPREPRGRVGSSEGRCPPPSPRGNQRDWNESYSDDEDEEYSSDEAGEDDPVKQLLSSVPVRGRGSTRTKLHADLEERKQQRRKSGELSSKMRSDNMRESRSRSRSPLVDSVVWVRPSKSSFHNDDRRGRSIHDRLGPKTSSHSNESRGANRNRNHSRRDHGNKHDNGGSRRHREDLRTRLG